MIWGIRYASVVKYWHIYLLVRNNKCLRSVANGLELVGNNKCSLSLPNDLELVGNNKCSLSIAIG